MGWDGIHVMALGSASMGSAFCLWTWVAWIPAETDQSYPLAAVSLELPASIRRENAHVVLYQSRPTQG